VDSRLPPEVLADITSVIGAEVSRAVDLDQ
jgi:hypothetical protein